MLKELDDLIGVRVERLVELLDHRLPAGGRLLAPRLLRLRVDLVGRVHVGLGAGRHLRRRLSRRGILDGDGFAALAGPPLAVDVEFVPVRVDR